MVTPFVELGKSASAVTDAAFYRPDQCRYHFSVAVEKVLAAFRREIAWEIRLMLAKGKNGALIIPEPAFAVRDSVKTGAPLLYLDCRPVWLPWPKEPLDPAAPYPTAFVPPRDRVLLLCTAQIRAQYASASQARLTDAVGELLRGWPS